MVADGKAAPIRAVGILHITSMESKMSQKERMCTGRLYYAIKDPELAADRNACRLLCAEYNATEGQPELSCED